MDHGSMERRGFLSALIGAAVLDPERLLWVPGRKLISVPFLRSACMPWDSGIPEEYSLRLARFLHHQDEVMTLLIRTRHWRVQAIQPPPPRL